ncbi:respiratory growth induced protein 1 [Diutina catenulata]
MPKKLKSTSVPLDLANCPTMDHLQAAPKARSASITSIETTDSNGSVTMVEKLMLPPIREFDELTSFEQFVRDETWDNEFDYFHAKLNYYPPFVMKQCKQNLDKIKHTANKNSRKFRRQLNHHVKNHLFKDLEKCCGYPLDFGKAEIVETPGKITWKYHDTSDHGFSPAEEEQYGRKWRLDLDISCTNENAMVEVDYRSMPCDTVD